MEKGGYVYIMGNKKPVLYIGVTSNLLKRTYEHRNDIVEGFSRQYQTHALLYFEVHDTIEDAIRREKQLKSWRRSWKLDLIKSMNPEFKDLYEALLQ